MPRAGADTVALYMAGWQSAEIAAALIGPGATREPPRCSSKARACPPSVASNHARRARRRAGDRFHGPVLLAIGEVFARADAEALVIERPAAQPPMTDKYTTETITQLRPWTESLFSFRTTRDRGYRFTPGQFARIGVRDPQTGETIWRAYSIASASYDEHLEFFSVVVPGGAFTSRLSTLREGDPILVERKSYGSSPPTASSPGATCGCSPPARARALPLDPPRIPTGRATTTSSSCRACARNRSSPTRT
jgi:hypothetical protein